MTTRQSIPRVRRVRMKEGGAEMRVIQAPDRVNELRRRVGGVLEKHGPNIGGFAFMVWDNDGASTCVLVGTDTIPLILVPDFVRNRLLAEVVQGWTLEEMNGE